MECRTLNVQRRSDSIADGASKRQFAGRSATLSAAALRY
jgi:hypothetical protein